MNIRANPYLLIIITTIIWSTSGAFVKLLQLPPTSFAFLRMAVPVLVFLPFLSGATRRFWIADNRLMLIASALNVFRLYFFFMSYTYAPIGSAVILLSTWPIFANIFSVFILKEAIPIRNAMLLVLAFLGIILVNLDKEIALDSEVFWGLSAAMACAVVNALAIVIFKRQSLKYTWYDSVFYQNLLGAIAFAPFFFLFNPAPSSFQLSGAVLFGLLIGVIAYGLFFSALKSVKASTASFLAYIEVAGAIIIGVIFFDEILSWNLVLGGIIIVTTTSLIRR